MIYKSVLIILGVTLLLASCTNSIPVDQSKETSKTLSSPPLPVLDNENALSVSDSLKKIPSKIQSDAAFRGCVSRTVMQCQSEVISAVARKAESADLCGEFADEALKNTCYISVFSEIARKKDDISICDQIPTDPSSCREQILLTQAISNKDTTKCSALAPKNTPVTVTWSVNIASLFNKADQCLLQVANALGEEGGVKVCEMIGTEFLKKDCINNIKMRAEMIKMMPARTLSQ